MDRTDGEGIETLSTAYQMGLRPRHVRDRLIDSMLVATAEIGYENVAVRHVVSRAGAGRQSFYSYFDNKEDCFAQAHEKAIEHLSMRVLGAAGREPSWREGLRAGLAELLAFCEQEPPVARAVFIETYSAGGAALDKRDEVTDRFAAAIDSARDAGAPHSPPAVTAAFTVGAIETMICSRLMTGETERMRDLLPGILHFTVLPYFGEEAAWEEMAAAPLANWEVARRERVAAPQPTLIPAVPGTGRR